MGAYRDQILQFEVGGHENDFIELELKPDVGYLMGNLYTSGYDNGISYALKPKYGPANYYGTNEIPVRKRTPAQAKRDHQLAMMHNAHESVSKREFFVTEDFHGKI